MAYVPLIVVALALAYYFRRSLFPNLMVSQRAYRSVQEQVRRFHGVQSRHPSLIHGSHGPTYLAHRADVEEDLTYVEATVLLTPDGLLVEDEAGLKLFGPEPQAVLGSEHNDDRFEILLSSDLVLMGRNHTMLHSSVDRAIAAGHTAHGGWPSVLPTPAP